MCCLECEEDFDVTYYTDGSIWAHPYLCPDCGGGMVKLINLTPHPVHLHVGDGSREPAAIIVLPPIGTAARCSVHREEVGRVGGVTIYRSVYGTVENLPEPEDGTYYIVSALVAQACPDRHDLLIPDDTVRDEDGRIIGCRALATVHGLGI